MFKRKRLLIGASFAATLLLYLSASPDILSASSNKNSYDDKLQAFLKFTRILNLIENQYVDEVNTSELINKALKGLMENLDPHSAYLTPKEYKDLNIQTKGEFGGLGIVVGIRNGALTVISPIEDTPAYKAGIKAGDIILKINDKATLGMSIDEAVKLMRGKPKTSIVLTIVRKGASKPLKIKIVRDIIKIKSVKPKLVDLDLEGKRKALYLRITSFDSHVVEEVKKAIKKYSNKTEGIIFDLRNNPGGLLDQAVGLLDMFIDHGVLVSQKGRNKKENTVYMAHKEGTDTKTPIVVLVNGGSASASEIVSGALQDTKRAIIVGQKTFGKGSVQVVIPIGKEEGLKLTVARYYLPSGRTIQNVGVTPNVIVYPGKVPKESDDELTIKERELKQHLKAELEKLDKENKKGKKDINSTSKKEDNSTKNKKLIINQEKLFDDAQLKSAVDILKVLLDVESKK